MRTRFALAGLVLCTAPLTAAETCTQAVISPQTPNWNQTITTPRFDPLSGTLTGVRIELDAAINGTSGIESPDSQPATWTLTFAARFELRRPDTSQLVAAQPSQTHTVSTTAFDGTIDFAGTSGITLPSSAATVPPAQVLLSAVGDLALFTGPVGAPGTIALSLSAQNACVAMGPGSAITHFSILAGADVRVCYQFTPRVEIFCKGDGSASACPCGNEAPLGTVGGCLNYEGLAGELTATGNPRLSADTLILHAASMHAVAPAAFFQGTSAENGGAGTVFGDGLLCVGGTLVRLGVRTSVGGALNLPSVGDPSISTAGSVAAPGIRTYQVWYRSGLPFCTFSTFNLTNGIQIDWLM